jgi:hypothetical protein
MSCLFPITHCSILNAAEMSANGECEQRLVDKKGLCPGDTGYVPVRAEPPADFAAFKAAAAAKKAAGN